MIVLLHFPVVWLDIIIPIKLCSLITLSICKFLRGLIKDEGHGSLHSEDYEQNIHMTRWNELFTASILLRYLSWKTTEIYFILKNGNYIIPLKIVCPR